MAALLSNGWNPSFSLDIVLEPGVQENLAESHNGELAYAASDTEFLRAIGIAPAHAGKPISPPASVRAR